MTPQELKEQFAQQLKEVRTLRHSIKVAYRQASDILPKSQRLHAADNLITALESLEELEKALIRSKAEIQIDD